jgi:hypothetical protein
MIHNHKTVAFRKDDAARKQLAEALDLPVIKSALDAIREGGIPKAMPEIYAGVHPDTIVAHDYHRKVGINEVLETLKQMTTPIKEVDPEFQTELPHGWKLPPELRKLSPELEEYLKKHPLDA